MRAFLAILLMSVALSGCLGGDDGPGNGNGETPDPALSQWHIDAIYGKGVDPAAFDHQDESEPHLELHDHTDPDHHKGLTTPNFEVLGWDPLETDYHGQTSGGYFCGGLAEEEVDGRLYAAIHSFSSEVALVVLDVTDPNEPFMVGELALPRTDIYDAIISNDGRQGVLSVSPTTDTGRLLGVDLPVAGTLGLPSGSYSDRLVFTDMCGNEYAGPEAELPFGPGTMLVDLSDPTDPQIADVEPAPVLGPHSISSTTVDGVEYVAASTTNLAYEASYFQFFTIDDTPLGAQLTLYNEYTSQYAQGETEHLSEFDPDAPGIPVLLNGHVEAEIFEHPLTGQLLASLANWDGGMHIIDISDPLVPTPVSIWGDSRDASISHSGQIHSVTPLPDLVDGRFIVGVGQETGSSFGETGVDHRPTGQIVLLDLTDPASPEPVARWTLPMQLHWSGTLDFSTHYFAFHEDVMYVAMYHGGVWAVDIAEDQWPELPSLGVWVADREAPNGYASQYVNYVPVTLDVFVLPGGELLTFDAKSGAYTLRFDPDDGTVPVIAPWTQDAWIDA